jgi:hypothetical protein
MKELTLDQMREKAAEAIKAILAHGKFSRTTTNHISYTVTANGIEHIAVIANGKDRCGIIASAGSQKAHLWSQN